MNSIRIGLCAASLSLKLRQALTFIQKTGAAGIELDAAGELAPRQLSETGRRQLRHLLASHNLDLAALACPLRFGLDTLENQEARIDHVRQAMTLAADLGPRRLILAAGKIAADEQDPGRVRLTEGLTALGQHGDRIGVMLALESGVDGPDLQEKLLAAIDSGSLAVNYDPAGLLMNGQDPFAAARLFGRRIVHVRARDARTVLSGRTAQEVPLGQGDLDWLQLLGTLEEIAYRGWLVIQRTGSTDPLGEARAGIDFFKKIR